MTLSQKLKSTAFGAVIALTSNAAYAQIVVSDPGAYPLQAATTSAVTANTTAVTTQGGNIVAAINAHDANRNSFETGATSTFYDDSRERLDKIINALSHVDNNTRDGNLYDDISSQDTAREKLVNLTDGNSTTFGVALPDTPTTEMTDYLKRYQFIPATDLYPTNIGLQNQVRDNQKALYYSEAMVGEVDAARQERFDVYKELANKAQNTEDVKAAMEVNNALLIENGRNLALLIHLQNAQLSAKAAQLRNEARQGQVSSELFGIRGEGP